MEFPSDFITRTCGLLGEEQFVAFRESFMREIPISIRVNRLKTDIMPGQSRRVGWCSSGYYLKSKPTFTFDPLFHAGCYYVQEASSMFLEQVLKQYVHNPVVMLDLCAAPGGKSTLARSALPDGSLLVANEVMRNRAQVLVENMTKWGHPDVMVFNDNPDDFVCLGEMFDVILVDMPCSGEGMFRKDPVAVQEWSEENIALCSRRQRKILQDIWPCLKPDGLLVYSTCTYNREENEDNVSWIAAEWGADVLPVKIRPEWNITGNIAGGHFPVYRFLPHRTEGEGLFMAVLRKPGNPDKPIGGQKGRQWKDSKKKGKASVVPQEVKSWVKCADEYVWSVEGNRIMAFPKVHQFMFGNIREYMSMVYGGIPVAEIKGRDFVPCHALAMSVCREEKSFPEVEIDYAQAIAYLRKETLALPAGIPRGYVLVMYRNVPLGFVKNIGNRTNNLYPQEWRIRSSYLPEKIVCAL